MVIGVNEGFHTCAGAIRGGVHMGAKAQAWNFMGNVGGNVCVYIAEFI
jgi:hypothetical protein